MNRKFICESIRLQRFLYSLGFDKESFFEDGVEKWSFNMSEELQESLDFYFNFRKKMKLRKGVNENASNTESKKMDRRRK